MRSATVKRVFLFGYRMSGRSQFPGAREGSVRAINFPGGYSSALRGVPGSGLTMVSTSPLTTPRTSRRSPSTATTRYCWSKIESSGAFIIQLDALLYVRDSHIEGMPGRRFAGFGNRGVTLRVPRQLRAASDFRPHLETTSRSETQPQRRE